MSSIKTTVLAAAAIALTIPVTSAYATSAQDVAIEYVRVKDNGTFEVRATQAIDPLCAQGGLIFTVAPHKLGVSSDGAKALLSVALTAYSLENPIDVVFDTSSAECFASEILIAR